MRTLTPILVALVAMIALHLSQGQPLPWSTSTDSVSLSQAGTSADPVASTSISPILVHAREVGPSDAKEASGDARARGEPAPDVLRALSVDGAHDILPGGSGLPVMPVGDAAVRRAAVIAAIRAHFPASAWAWAERMIDCESGGVGYDPAAVGTHGEVGVAQVNPRWWGPVPADISGQVWQASEIWRREGTRPWSCR